METAFHKQVTFSLSPAEFLAFVWVYRNEIHPSFEKCKNVSAIIPRDIKEYYSEIRHGILDGELDKCQLKSEEIKFFQTQSENLFAPFRNSKDKIRKPDISLIKQARSTMTELITVDDKGKLIELESTLINGNINFTVRTEREVILNRPY